MNFIMGILTNELFISAAVAWAIAQVSKVVIDIVKGNFSIDRLTGSGGMPSSHSATVTGLATASGILYGGKSFEFAMAFFFAFVVIYDALNVRNAAGKEAEILNRLRQRDIDEGKKAVYEKPLQEKLGHTILEVLAGIAIGIVAAAIVCRIMG